MWVPSVAGPLVRLWGHFFEDTSAVFGEMESCLAACLAEMPTAQALPENSRTTERQAAVGFQT
jgi:hypothetical protein